MMDSENMSATLPAIAKPKSFFIMLSGQIVMGHIDDRLAGIMQE